MSSKLSRLLLGVLFCLCCSSLHAEEATTRPISVGVILPFTGEGSAMAEAIRNGMQLAMESLEPELQGKIKLHFEDDSLSGSKAVSAFHKLVTQHQSDVIVNLSSGTGNAISPIAERSKVPFIAIASDPKIALGKEYSFVFWVTPDEQARV